MNRYEKRREKKLAEKIMARAKQDMQEYMMDYAAKTDGIPTEWELRAWQAGYVSGLNRAKAWEDSKDPSVF